MKKVSVLLTNSPWVKEDCNETERNFWFVKEEILNGSLCVAGETPGKETSGSGRSVSSGRNISKEVKAVPHDVSSPFSGNSMVSRRALRIL